MVLKIAMLFFVFPSLFYLFCLVIASVFDLAYTGTI